MQHRPGGVLRVCRMHKHSHRECCHMLASIESGHIVEFPATCGISTTTVVVAKNECTHKYLCFL